MRPSLVFLFCLSTLSRAQDASTSPILAAIEAHPLVVVKNKFEQRTTVKLNGASCAATKFTEVFIDTDGNPRYRLSYNVSFLIEDDKDPCLEGDVPEIDTKFDLTFGASRDSRSIDFKGERPTDCTKCKPKRARVISGTLARLSDRSYRVAFSGDLTDTVELEPTSTK